MYHRASRTLILVDLIENFTDATPNTGGALKFWFKYVLRMWRNALRACVGQPRTGSSVRLWPLAGIVAFILQSALRLSLPKTLQVLRQLRRERQVACVEAFDLLNAGAGILGEVEDVDLALRENDPHTNRGVA
jgi:hypothetical protein